MHMSRYEYRDEREGHVVVRVSSITVATNRLLQIDTRLFGLQISFQAVVYPQFVNLYSYTLLGKETIFGSLFKAHNESNADHDPTKARSPICSANWLCLESMRKY